MNPLSSSIVRTLGLFGLLIVAAFDLGAVIMWSRGFLGVLLGVEVVGLLVGYLFLESRKMGETYVG